MAATSIYMQFDALQSLVSPVHMIVVSVLYS